MLLARGESLGKYIDETYQLRKSSIRPLISIVTHGEIWSFAEQQSWGKKKRKTLYAVLDNLVTVDISRQVIDAYVEIDFFSQKTHKSSANMGKNDIWIAASAKATDSILLTIDADFNHLPLRLLKHEYIDQDRIKKNLSN